MTSPRKRKSIARVPRRPIAARLGERSESLAEKAYRRLEEMIVTLELAPGAMVSEAELSRKLGIAEPRSGKPSSGLPVRISSPSCRGAASSSPRSTSRSSSSCWRCGARSSVSSPAAPPAALRPKNASSPQDRRDHGRHHSARRRADLRSPRSRPQHPLRRRRAQRVRCWVMAIVHSLSRRFWIVHYRQAADLAKGVKSHGRSCPNDRRGRCQGSGEGLRPSARLHRGFTRASLTDFL